MRKNACPCCGGMMKSGKLTGMNEVWWHPDDEKKPELKDFLSWEGFKKLCSPITGNIQVPVRGEWETARTQLPAHYCPDCQLFLFRGRYSK